MIQSRTNCRQVAVCRGGHGGLLAIAAIAPKRCYVRIAQIVKEGGGEEGGGDRGRSPNSRR
jgi:hypothetical protein